MRARGGLKTQKNSSLESERKIGKHGSRLAVGSIGGNTTGGEERRSLTTLLLRRKSEKSLKNEPAVAVLTPASKRKNHRGGRQEFKPAHKNNSIPKP